MRWRALIPALLPVLAACDGIEDPIALDEPIVVHQADFKRGALPSAEAGPALTSLSLGFGVLRPGALDARVEGRAAGAAYSVGIRLAGQGSGYWVLPVGAEDPLIPGELHWQLALDAASAIEPGQHQLEAVAFDERGQPGPKQTLPVCVASELPDNLNVCNPTTQPPLAVASLHWNADSDLDLTVVAPDGMTFGRSRRSLLAGTNVIARLDGDGVSGCLADGRRRENFVWNQPPPAGTWNLFVNIFDACSKAAVSFDLTIYVRQQNADGTFSLVPAHSVGGQFVRAQANGGAAQPLFVSDITF